MQSVVNPITLYIKPKNLSIDRLDPHYYVLKQKINLMKNVRSVYISELCEFISDGTRKALNFVSVGVPYIKISNIRNHQIDLSTAKYVDSHYGIESKAIVQKDDILISKIAAIPKVAIVDENVDGAVVNPDLLIIRPKDVKARDLIFNFFKSTSGQLSLQLAVTPSIIPKISIKEIVKLLIPIYEYSHISCASPKSEKGQYKDRLTDFYQIDEKRYEGDDPSNLLWVKNDLTEDRIDVPYYQQRNAKIYKDFIECVKREEWVQLSKVADIVDKTISPSKYKDQTISYVGVKNLEREKWLISSIDKVPYKNVKSRARYELNTGDILLGIIGTNIGKKEQPLAIVTDQFANSIASNVFAVIRSDYISPFYLLWCLSHFFVRFQIRLNSKGAMQPFLSISDLKHILIPLFSNNRRNEIERIVEQYQGGTHGIS